MKSLLKTSVGVVALLTGAGMALAQDAGTAGTQQMASDITCAQIVELDTDEAERALYFVAGYRAAQGETDTSAAATGMNTGAPTDTTAAADAETGAATEMDTDTTAATDDAGADLETDTTASAADTDAGMDTDTAAADTATDTDTTTTAGTTADTTGAAGGSGTFAATGYFEIPIESVMTACETTPDSRVSDILTQQGGTAQ